MKKILTLSVAGFSLAVLCSALAVAQPPDGGPGEGPPSREGGGQGGREGEPGQGRPRPRPWEPGKVMPPHVQHALELSTDQQKQIADLEGEVRDRIMKILTDEQKAKLKALRPMGPPPGEGQGQGQGQQNRRGRRPGPPRGGQNGGGPDGAGAGGPGPDDAAADDGPPPRRGPRLGPLGGIQREEGFRKGPPPRDKEDVEPQLNPSPSDF